MNFFLKLTVSSFIAAASAQRIPDGGERREILDAHNHARREMAVQYNVANMGELVWSDAAAQYGLNWLNQQSCAFMHSDDSYAAGFGENIAGGYRSWTVAAYESWYKGELSCYKNAHPNWGNCGAYQCTCGHMTAMTWAATTVVGCAQCDSPKVYICNYGSAPPNMGGQNVFDAGSGAPCSNCSRSLPYCSNNLCTAGNAANTAQGGLLTALLAGIAVGACLERCFLRLYSLDKEGF